VLDFERELVGFRKTAFTLK